MDKNNPSNLSETLFIPLSVRANETKSEAAAVKDPKAVEIISKVSTAGIITDGGSISTLGILARTIVIDSEVKKILEQALIAVIIILDAFKTSIVYT